MDKIRESIKRIKLADKMSRRYYGQPLIVTNSGGKDSLTCIELCRMADIEFEVLHSHTTADAPETVYYIREQHEKLKAQGYKCDIIYPTYKGEPTSMWKLIPEKRMPPTRLVRYCCDVLKETGGRGRAKVTGVRNSESRQRASRKYAEKIGRRKSESVAIDFERATELFETDGGRRFTEHDAEFMNNCRVKGTTVFNPIIDWSDADVWAFIRSSGLKYNPLYDCGFTRVGCVGCPMAYKKHRAYEFAKFPKFELMYKCAFRRMLDARRERGLETKWQTADEVFNWWIEKRDAEGQITVDNYLENK